MHSQTSDLQERLIQTLNVPHGNTFKARQAFDTLLLNHERNRIIHSNKVSKLESQIENLNQQIENNYSAINHLRNPANSEQESTKKVAEVEVDALQLQQQKIQQQTSIQLQKSQHLLEQQSKINSQEEYVQQNYQKSFQEAEQLRIKNKVLEEQLTNTENEAKQQLKAILKIIEEKPPTGRVQSGRYSSLGFRKSVQSANQTIDSLNQEVISGVELLLKQKRQLELEEKALDVQLKQIEQQIQQEIKQQQEIQ